MNKNDHQTRVALKAQTEVMGIGDGEPLGDGQFRAIVSVFDVVDSQGDVIRPGAFAHSIEQWKAGQPLPILYSHRWEDPYDNIGEVTDMQETAEGLEIAAQLDMSNPTAVQAFKLLKDRRCREFSIAGEESDVEYVEDADDPYGGYWNVKQFDLIEISICLRGSNPETRLLETKAQNAPADTDTADTFVRDMSRDDLASLVRDVLESKLAEQHTTETADETATPSTQTEPEPQDLPDLTAWAADMEAQLMKGTSQMSAKTELSEALTRIKAIATKAQTENREFTAQENRTIIDLREQAEQAKKALATETAARKAVEDMLGDSTKAEATAHGTTTYKSAGEAFVHSDNYRAFKALPSSNHVSIPSTVAKADPVIDTSNNAKIPHWMPGYVDLTYPQHNVFLDLITRGTTTSSYVAYRQLVANENNAAIVPETGKKPLSSLAMADAEARDWTVADGFKVTTQELKDDGIIAEVINNTLIRDLDEFKESVIIGGDASTDPHAPTGILDTEGLEKVAFDTDVVTTVRKALSRLTRIHTNVEAIVMNPADAEKVDLLQNKNGDYLGNGPFALGPARLWGVPIVECAYVPEGTALMGDFKTVHLYNHDPLEIQAFTQNEDDAMHNLVYMRAEERDMLFIREPRRIALMDIKTGVSAASKKGE